MIFAGQQRKNGRKATNMEEKEIVVSEQGVENQSLAASENNDDSVSQAQNSLSAKTDRNAFFADMRRKQQLKQARADNAKLQRQIDTAQKAMEILSGISKEKAVGDGHISENSEYNSLSENAAGEETSYSAQMGDFNGLFNSYREMEVQRMMADDLKEIQSLDPTITSLGDLPDTFLALRFNQLAPMTAREAFVAAKTIMQQTKPPKPASAGSISGSGGGESEFFTSEELDNLTPKMLDNSKIMEKALRSMARLNKERG